MSRRGSYDRRASVIIRGRFVKGALWSTLCWQKFEREKERERRKVLWIHERFGFYTFITSSMNKRVYFASKVSPSDSFPYVYTLKTYD